LKTHPECNHEFSGLMVTFTARQPNELAIAEPSDQVTERAGSEKILEIEKGVILISSRSGVLNFIEPPDRLQRKCSRELVDYL